MKEYKKLGIYGGTFNPVHCGHVSAAMRFYDEIGLDCLIIMPALIPPHKSSEAESPTDRLEMLRLAFADCGRNVVISDYEISRGGTSYTYLTLEHFAGLSDSIYLLCGTDMFLTLDSWREPDTIFRLCTPVIVRRENDSPEDEIAEAAGKYRKKYGVNCLSVSGEPLEISSTGIRKMLEEDDLTPGLLPEKVFDFIRFKGLYGVTGKLKHGSEVIRSELSLRHDEKRIPHILGVEKEMRRLASIYCLGEYDTELGAIAALLHDVTKKETVGWHVDFLLAHGIEPDLDTLSSPKTLHQLTGSILAGELYPTYVKEPVRRAISVHTTGSDDMTLLDKLLFIADFTEETRTFDSCVALRSYFEKQLRTGDKYTALDKTMLRAYRIIIKELREDNKPIHKKTLAAYRAALKGRKNG
ncbi:MAG: nicotinate (nicotinamide) nucleotide adenylyltransferase [Clostridia bacterium]|nr:nicotinate (nicotinamide) nucleotide adenylyltransferase [Clostridia bacterium]